MQHCPVGALQSILIIQVSGYDQVQGPCFVFWFKLMFDFGGMVKVYVVNVN